MPPSPDATARRRRTVSSRLRGVALGLPVLVGCTGRAASDVPVTDATLVIAHVTVIDGSGAPPFEDASILVSGNRISWVGSASDVWEPAGVPVYDGRGQYAIPGLWDMHTHALWEPFVEDGFLRLFLVNGVTGIRDMGGTLAVVQSVRPGGALDSPTNPRIVAAGPWLNEFIIDPRAGIAVETPEAAREAVSNLVEAGVDFIKVYVQLPRDVFLAIVDEAGRHGLPVAGHVPVGISSAEAAELGMRSIEHMRSEIGGYCEEVGEAGCDDLLHVFRRNGTWQTPTLLIRGNRAFLDEESFARDTTLRYAPADLRADWESTRAGRLATESFDELRGRFAAELELATRIHRAGLPILAGSDAGDLYSLAGFSIHDELALLVEAGLSPAEALRAATLSPAEYLTATDSLGTIEPGMLADIVLLEANPLEDIRNTKGVRAVVRDGRLFDRAALDDILREIVRAAASEDRDP